MKPYGDTLMAYHSGDLSASFEIKRDDGFRQVVPASVFYSEQAFPYLESCALDACNGRVLDIGAGAGRHSLELIRRGFSVTALDILPCFEKILRARGVTEVIISDIFTFSGRRFDTLLMLMNGIGMVGTPDRLDRFLSHAHEITTEDGQIICDSVDVSVSSDPIHVAYREKNIDMGRPIGQQFFIMTYDNESEPFKWLHIDFTSLQEHCQGTGWEPCLIHEEADGHYLCRLKKN